MKVLQFNMPLPLDKSVISEQVSLPHFYPFLHRHEEAQITWIQEGEGTLITGNNMHTFSGGEIYVIGSNTPHLFKSNPEYFDPNSTKTIKAYSVFFNPQGILAPMFDLPEMKNFKVYLEHHQLGFKAPETYFEEISVGLLNIKDSTGADQIFNLFKLLKILQGIDAKLIPLCEFNNATAIAKNEGFRIASIFSYINEHYSEPISLDDVANTAYMTPQAFCRYFKKHTGHTFTSFLYEVRINEACKKLTSNQFISISTVAYNCGFNSITNFNRVFKLIIGTSPRNYIENYANYIR